MQSYLSLAQALRLNSSPCIAFIGSGGKTTAMFQAARTLSGAERVGPVIVTATSHLGAWQTTLADRHIITASPALEELEHGLKGVVLITGEIDGTRTKPINDQLLSWLRQFCGDHSIPLLIEADGSREKPLKAWADHEPPIPAFVELVVQVIQNGRIGDVRAVQVAFSYTNTDLGNIRNQKEVGGGALYDIGGYAISAARMAFGTEPKRAVGACALDPKSGCDVLTSAILDFGTGQASFVVGTTWQLVHAIARCQVDGARWIWCAPTPAAVRAVSPLRSLGGAALVEP